MTPDLYDDSITPPQNLENFWRAVVEQNLRDGVAKGDTAKVRNVRREARAWFTARDLSYRYVCELAGFDPDDLANRALRHFAKADLDQEEQPQCNQ